MEMRRKEKGLFIANIGERNLVSTLCCYLKKKFSGWDVDFEYDSQIQKNGRISPKYMCFDRLVTPDILIHHRNRFGRSNNRLAIEVKKSNSTDKTGLQKDADVLEKFTNKTGDKRYQYGLRLIIDMSGVSDKYDWYKNGIKGF